MAYRRGPKEPIPEKETVVWSCTNEECSCWMRDAFSNDEKTICPICKSVMEKEIRVLPVIS
ncbi:cold-shock protein [Lederbergia ruris]|uniref:Cold-shock protein n=1 Tax=Lederbergia ruris TaxID=217495 RepID=A0ABQ4KGZ8_9BACI|nr:cold-shock protein [Lederbergia ruris]GIN56608.1 cold-shock protein [Lederbergia ruris]